MRFLYYMILIVALGLRVYNAAQGGFFEDEFFYVFNSKKIFDPQVYRELLTYETNPFLFFLLLKGVVSVLGEDPFILRLPFVAFGMLSIVYSYKLTKLIAPKAALMAMALFAVHNQSIVKAAFVRNYVLLEFFTVFLFYYCMKHKEKINLKLYALLSFCTLTSHFTGIFPVAASVLYLISLKRGRSFNLKVIMLSGLTIIPNLIQTIVVLSHKVESLNWIPGLGSTVLWEYLLLRLSIVEDYVSLAILAPLAVFGFIMKGKDLRIFFYAMGVGCLVFGFYALLKGTNIMYWNTVSSFLIALLIFSAIGISILLPFERAQGVLIIGVLGWTLFHYWQVNPRILARTNYEIIYQYVKENIPKDNRVVIAGCYQEMTMSKYYLDKLGMDNVRNHLVCDIKKLPSHLKASDQDIIFLVDQSKLGQRNRKIGLTCPKGKDSFEYKSHFGQLSLYHLNCSEKNT